MTASGAHWTIATVCGDTIEKVLRSVKSTSNVDRIEVRLDFLWPEAPDIDTATDHLLLLTESMQIPLIATLRPIRQGGRFDGDEAVRLSLLGAAVKCGFETVDLEADNADLIALVRNLNIDARQVIASTHLAVKAPSKDGGLMALQAMQDSQASVQKLTFPAGAFPDILRAIELAHQFRNVHGRPSVIPLGFGGPMGRALIALAGGRATYGHAHGSLPAVPGIPSITSIQDVWEHWGLNRNDLDSASGRWLAAIGAPVEHSGSPAIHNGWLRAAGRTERYGALTVPESMGSIRLLFGIAERLGLAGVSVTSPLKIHALEASSPDATAQAAGAANTVRFVDGRIESTNTDSLAFQEILASCQGPVAVLGAGGAARAAIHAAQKCGLEVTFTSRDETRAKQVSEQFDVAWISWSDRAKMEATTWIQCTTLGSNEGDESPLPVDASCSLSIEMVYGAGTTAFERDAAARGVTCISGEQFLRRQAAHQFQFFTGERPPNAEFGA